MKRLGLAAATLLAAAPGTSHGQGFSGQAEVRGFGYVTAASRADPGAALWTSLRVKQEARRGRVFVAIAGRAEWLTSAERGPLKLDLADRAPRRSPLQLGEAWLRLALARSIDLEAGRMTLGWGKTDGYSPADAFLPRDASDPFADEKLPLWVLRARGQRGALRFDVVAVPVSTPWRLPVLAGRFAPLDDPRAHLVDGAIDPPRTGFAAARALLTRGRLDVGLWGRAGLRPAPLLVLRGDQARPARDGLAIPADRRWAHESGAGLEAARVSGPWILRAEAGLLHSADAELGSALLVSVSAERALGDSTLLATLAANLDDPPVAPALLFDRAILPALIVAFNRSEPWGEWKAVWTQGLDHGDGLVKLEAAYRMTDRWSLAGGIDWPFGTRRGPLGALRHARRAHAALRRAW